MKRSIKPGFHIFPFFLICVSAEKMKARVQEQKVAPQAKQTARMHKKGKGLKSGGRFVFSCEGLSKSLPTGAQLFSDLTFSLYERYLTSAFPCWEMR